jgi:hypothetical protein
MYGEGVGEWEIAMAAGIAKSGSYQNLKASNFTRVAFLGAGVDIFGPSSVFLNLHCSAVGPPCVFPVRK